MIDHIIFKNGPLLGIVVVVGTIAGTTPQATAATADGTFAARGIGAFTCERIVNLEGDDRDSAILTLSSWIAGYVSHANRMAENQFEVTPFFDNAVLASMVVQLCDENPAALVESIFASVLEATAGGGQQAESELVELQNGDFTVTLRSGALARVQQVLSEKDFLAPAEVDGEYGPKTRDALVSFQQQQALTQTGLPDAPTMLGLFGSE